LKNKKGTYILLVAAIGIWGTIIYKIIDGLSTDEKQSIAVIESINFKIPEPKKVDSFSLLRISRDPFLDKPLVPDKKKVKPKQAKIKIDIPLVYHGMMKKNNGKERLFIVSINGQQTFIKKGQEIQGIILLNGNETKVTVSFKGVRKTIDKG
jgi:hypothetical protein